ncbi:MAG: hypothetical protein QW400_02040 [Candidatus Diapherotrites archaeon]
MDSFAIFCSATNDDLQGRYSIYAWAKTDSKKQNIVAPTTIAGEIGTKPTFKLLTATGSAITFDRGDKLVAEISFYGVSPTTAIGTLSYNGYNSTTRDSNIIAPVSIRFAGNLDTAIVSPQNNSKKVVNTDFDINVKGQCLNYSCGDTNVTLLYCIDPASGCSQWLDMNTDSSSPLYISSGAYFRRDNLLDVSDTNYFVFTVRATQTGTYTIRSKIDSDWSEDINYSNFSDGDINIKITLPPDYSFSLSYPASGCTYGKGSIDQDNSCDMAYFEPTDLSGIRKQSRP